MEEEEEEEEEEFKSLFLQKNIIQILLLVLN
jgi:hypothetical protein